MVDINGRGINFKTKYFKKDVTNTWGKAPSRVGTREIYNGYNTKSSCTGIASFYYDSVYYLSVWIEHICFNKEEPTR